MTDAEKIAKLEEELREARRWLKDLEWALDTETQPGAQKQEEFWEYLRSVGLG